jgi:hypothetical protein
LLPNELGTQHEGPHEERLVELALGCLHHFMKGETEVPRDAQVILALPAEGSREE